MSRENVPCRRDPDCYRNDAHEGAHMYPDQPGCYEHGCGRLSEWRVTTARGNLPFCQQHAEWFIAKGPDIYPRQRLIHQRTPA